MKSPMQDLLSVFPKCLFIALLIFTGLVLFSVEVRADPDSDTFPRQKRGAVEAP